MSAEIERLIRRNEELRAALAEERQRVIVAFGLEIPPPSQVTEGHKELIPCR